MKVNPVFKKLDKYDSMYLFILPNNDLSFK